MKTPIRQFIIDNFLFGQSGNSLEDDESFLDTGIVDSTGVLQLVGFLERHFSITIADDELIPDNLDSVNKVSCFVQRKLGQPSATIDKKERSVSSGA